MELDRTEGTKIESLEMFQSKHIKSKETLVEAEIRISPLHTDSGCQDMSRLSTPQNDAICRKLTHHASKSHWLGAWQSLAPIRSGRTTRALKAPNPNSSKQPVHSRLIIVGFE